MHRFSTKGLCKTARKYAFTTLQRHRDIAQSGAMKKLMILMVLAACAKSPTHTNGTPMKIEDRLPVGIDDSCGAKRYHTLLGQDATALERILILGQVRVVRPGTISTQDYRPERMNFHVGDNGKIARISCG